MIVNADIYVKDVPGQLVGFIEPISLVDGNIIGVVHNRDNIMGGRIGVNITFEIDSAEKLEKIKNAWDSRDIMILRMSSVVETFPMEYMFIGDIGPARIERLIKDAGKVVGLESVDVRYSSRISSRGGTAMISASVRSEGDLTKLDNFMLSECEKEDITCIRGIGQ